MAIGLFLIVKFSQSVLLIGALLYIFSGIWARAAYSWSRRRRRHSELPMQPSDADSLHTP
jgi:CDP-diacylglycerol--serine O-phosphatidyltransferase